MKAIKDGYTVGIALESFDGENATMTVMILGSPTSSGEVGLLREVKTGKILVFVNLGYSKLDVKYEEVEPPDGGSTSSYFSIDQQTGKVTAGFTACLDLRPR